MMMVSLMAGCFWSRRPPSSRLQVSGDSCRVWARVWSCWVSSSGAW